jgi:hypothetical protein
MYLHSMVDRRAELDVRRGDNRPGDVTATALARCAYLG